MSSSNNTILTLIRKHESHQPETGWGIPLAASVGSLAGEGSSAGEDIPVAGGEDSPAAGGEDSPVAAAEDSPVVAAVGMTAEDVGGVGTASDCHHLKIEDVILEK